MEWLQRNLLLVSLGLYWLTTSFKISLQHRLLDPLILRSAYKLQHVYVVDEGKRQEGLSLLCVVTNTDFLFLKQDEQACWECSLHIVLPVSVTSSMEVFSNHRQTRN